MARLANIPTLYRAFLIALMLALLPAPGFTARAAPTEPAQTAVTFRATVVKVRPDHRAVWVNLAGLPGPHLLLVPNTDLQAALAPVRPNDQMRLVVDDTRNPHQITSIPELTRAVTPWRAGFALGGAVAFLLLVCLAMTSGFDRQSLPGIRFKPLALVTGADGRLSNSQCQLALWFASVAMVYTATIVLRATEIGTDFIGGVSMTGNLIAMTGFSAFTFGAAKLVATQQAGGAAPANLRPTGPELADLARNGLDQPDLGDLQMILVTVAAVTIFLCQSYWSLRDLSLFKAALLPDVDGALLASFGLGQGAYLIKKAATARDAG